MNAERASQSAMSAAVARGTHRLWDARPWLVDDPFALQLVGAAWFGFAASARALVRPDVWRRGHTFVLLRTRYPEDRLVAGGFEQYVILGAGLDSFAWRRRDLLGPLRVYEVDHPATQAWKRDRAAALGLPASGDHVFVPVDFEAQDLSACLDESGFDWGRPAIFSWVGTTMYLRAQAVADTLSVVRRCARGSEIALSYNLATEFVDDAGRTYLAAFRPRADEMGEPLRSSFAPSEIEALVAACGLAVADHPTSEDLCNRYCTARENGLRPSVSLERMLVARIGPA